MDGPGNGEEEEGEGEDFCEILHKICLLKAQAMQELVFARSILRAKADEAIANGPAE